jgi:hypothetical protein
LKNPLRKVVGTGFPARLARSSDDERRGPGRGAISHGAPPEHGQVGQTAFLIVIAVVALIAEWLLTMIEDRLLTWRPETTVNA